MFGLRGLFFCSGCIDTATHFPDLSLFLQFLFALFQLLLFLKHGFVHEHFLHFAVFN